VPRRRTFAAAEFAFGVGVLGEDPLVAEGAMSIRDGKVTVPDGPGLGLVLDTAALDRMTLWQATVS